jgi:hypothetical protein
LKLTEYQNPADDSSARPLTQTGTITPRSVGVVNQMGFFETAIAIRWTPTYVYSLFLLRAIPQRSPKDLFEA